tara:strand:+ start:445 stop:1059 length:615 start_codon:yes stop_codon:yes gene_type:complete
MDKSIIPYAVTLFALSNPFGNAVVFVTMMQTYSKKQAQLIALKLVFTVWFTMMLVSLLGSQLLHLFGISFQAFSVAGGILLSSIGITMSSGEQHASSHNEKHQKANEESDPTIVPLTIPLISGPGAMVTIIAYFAHHNYSIDTLITSSVAVTAIAIAIGAIFAASTLLPPMKEKWVYVSNRIMGLIITSMGLELILKGLKNYFM